jgi:hypothetical protein
VSEAIGQVRIAGTATIWLGLFDGNNNLLTDPVQVYAGGLDVPTLDDSGETCSISITCENPLLSLNLAPNRQFDDADQQIYYPGDLGFSMVEGLANGALFWPAPMTTTSPYPLYMTLALSSPDLAVGGTSTITATIHYSDGSTYSGTLGVGHSGSGPPFIFSIGSTNPKVATFSYSTFLITGVGPGACSIVARVPIGIGTSGASQQYRAAVAMIVHS